MQSGHELAALEAKLLPEAPLFVLPTLAVAIGLHESIVLQQLHYRSRIKADGWWRGGPADLRREFPFWSDTTSKRILDRLRQLGFVQVRQAGTDRANQYQLNYDALREQIPSQQGQSAPIDRGTLHANRPDASGQSAPIPIERGKGKRGRGSAPDFSRFDRATQ
jgi:hypothetical protein